MAARVFGHYPRHEKVQKIIFATGFGAAAAHFESAKRMPPHNRASAGAIDVNIAGFESRFHAFDIIRAA